MFDNLKVLIKKLFPDKILRERQIQYGIKPKYHMFLDMLKENGYIIDRNVQITEMDTEFVQTYDIDIRHTESGIVVINHNYDLMTLKVPGNNSEVRFISSGQAIDPNYCHRLEIEHFPKQAKVEIFKYNTSLQNVRHISIIDDINRSVVVFPGTGIEMTTHHELIWALRYFDDPIKFEDVDIKKESVKYSGQWDICVHKDAQDKFAWWKDGKYVGGQHGK